MTDWVSDEEIQKQQMAQQRAMEAQQAPRLSGSSERLINYLKNNDLKGFVSAYIDHLQNNNNTLVPILGPGFQKEEKNVLEILHSIYNDNVKDEPWSVSGFFVTIMNIGMSIGNDAPDQVYDILLLTTRGTPSPIYGIATHLDSNKDPEIIELFNSKWNSMFHTETFVSPTIVPSFMSKLSRQTQFLIVAVIVLLIAMVVGVTGYFASTRPSLISLPKMETPEIAPSVSSVDPFDN